MTRLPDATNFMALLDPRVSKLGPYTGAYQVFNARLTEVQHQTEQRLQG